jgi:hypothetical protein
VDESSIEVDYLIIGAGASGMAFADSLLEWSDATIALVDRNHRPGGHWNDAYSFVRLHQAASTYGVNSRPLGTGARDEVGLNQGLMDLASGQEVLSHFDLVMQQSFLPTGRVQYFPMSEYGDDGSITHLLSGERQQVIAGKVVDGTHSKMSVPSKNPPKYTVDPAITCLPLNDLPKIAHAHESYVVIGAGKTGMDACIWLLQNGVDPDNIQWIMPRDAWLLSRANSQPTEEYFGRFSRSIADQVEVLADADSIDEVFSRLEAMDEFRRIDPTVKPEAYHCAIVSDGELEQFRRIKNIVRLGRVKRIDRDQIVLEHGTIPTSPNCLHIDCSAIGFPKRPSKQIFDGHRITLQMVRICQPTFSAALLGYVEATFGTDAEKNRMCSPIASPNVPADWLTMMETELANRQCWSSSAELNDWIANARLDQFTGLIRSRVGIDEEATDNLARYLQNVGPAVTNLEKLQAG